MANRWLPLLVAVLAFAAGIYVGLGIMSGTITAPEWLSRMFEPKTVIPVERKEQWWQDEHRALVDRARENHVGLLFVGDSITEGMKQADDIIERLWGPAHPAHFGIGGDTTELLLWRLQNGELQGVDPQVVVLLIGTNNLGNSNNREIVAGIRANVEQIRKSLPRAKILVLGILPRSQFANDPVRDRIKTINGAVSAFEDGQHVFFADVGGALLESNGDISDHIMPDYLHPNHEGYRRMFDALRPFLDPLLNAT